MLSRRAILAVPVALGRGSGTRRALATAQNAFAVNRRSRYPFTPPRRAAGMPAAYPTSTAVASAPFRPASGGAAEGLVLVGLILQVVGGLILLGGIGWLFGFSLLYPYPYWWVALPAAGGVAAVVVVFLYLVYTLSYARIRRQEYAAAQTPTLVLGILSLFVGIVPGILYLLAYVKLGDALREQSAAVPLPQVACRSCGRVHPVGAFTFCPNCGQKI